MRRRSTSSTRRMMRVVGADRTAGEGGRVQAARARRIRQRRAPPRRGAAAQRRRSLPPLEAALRSARTTMKMVATTGAIRAGGTAHRAGVAPRARNRLRKRRRRRRRRRSQCGARQRRNSHQGGGVALHSARTKMRMARTTGATRAGGKVRLRCGALGSPP